MGPPPPPQNHSTPGSPRIMADNTGVGIGPGEYLLTRLTATYAEGNSRSSPPSSSYDPGRTAPGVGKGTRSSCEELEHIRLVNLTEPCLGQ